MTSPGRRRAGPLLLSGVVLAVGLGSGVVDGAPSGEQRGAVTEVYARVDWYRTHPEPERSWRGILRERPVAGGPGERAALRYALVVAEGPTLAVYAAGVEQLLAAFVGREVIVHGKRVDLTTEGFGPELWIGAIAVVPR